jgi:hypothetical protein
MPARKDSRAVSESLVIPAIWAVCPNGTLHRSSWLQ